MANLRPNSVDRYLVQFQDRGKDHFVTDCAFRYNQQEEAITYAAMVLETPATGVVRAKVIDAWNDGRIVFEKGV